MVENKMNKSKLKKGSLIQFISVIVFLICLNIISSIFNYRLDLTEDNRYSLSDNTKGLLQNDSILKDRIFFKIYLEGDLPAEFKNIRNNIQYILDEFIAYAGDNIQYEFINPTESDDDTYNRGLQERIFNKGEGILPTTVNSVDSDSKEQFRIWPGAIVEYQGNTADVIQFFDREMIVLGENVQNLVDNTINNLEFKLISSIRRVTNTNRKSIGFLEGHGELDENQTREVRNELKKDYNVGSISIDGKIDALVDLDALVVAKPLTAFTEKEKFIIDQFIMHGGRVLWFIDPIDVNRDSLAFTGETMGLSRNLNIENDLIYKYGARINKDIIIDDNSTHELIPPNNLRAPGLQWIFYPLIQSGNHPIVNNIDPIKTEYTSSVEPVNLSDKKVKKTILLTSSNYSKSLMAPVRINYGFAFDKYKPDLKNSKFGNNPIALLLEGEFSSPFENRISEAFLSSDDYKSVFKSVKNKMLVVSDGDMINGSFTYFKSGQKKISPIPLSVDRFYVKTQNGTPKFYYGNKDFFLNAIDYLLDDNSLISIRSKTINLRMLDEDKMSEDKSFWKVINIITPIVLILLLAIVLLLFRKRKYGK